jgi:hypothetical protein
LFSRKLAVCTIAMNVGVLALAFNRAKLDFEQGQRADRARSRPSDRRWLCRSLAGSTTNTFEREFPTGTAPTLCRAGEILPPDR